MGFGTRNKRCINYTKGGGVMTELNETHFELHSANKHKLYKQKMKDTLNDLLKKYDADDLIAYIMDQSEKD
jgi:hypothetical protein